MRFFSVAALALLACTGFLAASATERERSITVSGVGKISYVPDMGYIHVGVSSEGSTAAEAWQKNEAIVKKIFDALKSLGIHEKDLKTTNLNLQPRYHHKLNETPKLIGYTASYDLNVTVRKLSQMSQLLDRMVDAGANRNMNISFGCSKLDELQDQARVKAVESALKKANLYATTAGARLGDVLSISDSPVQHFSRLMPVDAIALREGTATLPIAAGEQEVTVNVTISWGLENRKAV
jgi:uncharacterized protein